ncbi:hypothetical protein ACOMHN_041684 [Nucella lapillus]
MNLLADYLVLASRIRHFFLSVLVPVTDKQAAGTDQRDITQSLHLTSTLSPFSLSTTTSSSHKPQQHPLPSTFPTLDETKMEERKPRKNSTTTTVTTTTTIITTPRSSSIPTLPDVHKAPSTAPQGNFLHTLLMEEKLERQEEENDEESTNLQDTEVELTDNNTQGSISSRSVVTKRKGKVASQEGQGHRRLSMSDDRDAKNLPAETLTARADKILTSTGSGSGDIAARKSPREQRRRRSRDVGTSSSTTSGRRLSGPVLPFKKKFKHRLSHGYDPTQSPGSQRRYSSPATSGLAGSSSKLLDLSLKLEGDVVISLKEESSVKTDFDSVDMPTVNAEKSISDSAQISSASENPSNDLSDADKRVDSDNLSVIDESGSDVMKVPSDLKGMQTLPSEESHSDPIPSSTATGVTPLTSGSAQVTSTALTSTTPENLLSVNVTDNKGPETSQPFSQWTSCRALEDSEDDDIDNENDNNNNDNISLGYSRISEMDAHFDSDSHALDGRFSRAGSSSNLARKKRPLLLPPIMLPPLHTVKPKPMVLRDDVYFATLTPRTRGPLNEEEWEKLKECRYLRIRPWRKTLKA